MSEQGKWLKKPPKNWPPKTIAWVPQPLDQFLRWLIYIKHGDRGKK